MRQRVSSIKFIGPILRRRFLSVFWGEKFKVVKNKVDVSLAGFFFKRLYTPQFIRVGTLQGSEAYIIGP